MQLTITKLGLVCAVGLDVDAACAAIRAGIQRRADSPEHVVLGNVEEGGEAEPLGVHGVPRLTDGFSMVARWTRLAGAAIRDVARQLDGGSEAIAEGCGLVLVVPDFEPRFPTYEPFEDDDLRSLYVEPLLAASGLALPPERRALVRGDHVAAYDAFAAARALLSERGAERVLIVAADSFLESGSVEWLANQSRLKTPVHAAGLEVGEAGAALLVEPLSEEAKGLTVHGLATGQEPAPPLDGEAPPGAALARSIASVLESTDAPFDGDWIPDINGETWRSYQVGFARAALGPDHIREDVALVVPTVSTGEVGCAQPLVALCAASRAAERGYAASPWTLMTSGDATGRVGSLLVRSEL